ncbi:MAG TPA: AAA family ATPase [Bacteroidia bacterium]|jgi:hypothetical protein
MNPLNFTRLKKIEDLKSFSKEVEFDEFLNIRSASETMRLASLKPIPKMLFSELWHEGEICILFADTNIGKSILSVQIADSISRGEPVRGFRLEAYQQVVLYFDFEMSMKQFEKRYSDNYTRHYDFDDRFLRIDINPDCTNFDDFEKTLFSSIEKAVGIYNATVLIIDNLTWLKTETTESAKEALPLMKRLKELKVKHGLSLLILAHTPKRSPFNPIGINDMAGSKHLANFADSIFAIGKSHRDGSLRYIKQIKARDTDVVFDSDNVILCEIIKPFNFLGFEFSGFGKERDHLSLPSSDETDQTEMLILELRSSEPSISKYEIAKRLGINQMKVKRVLDKQAGENNLKTNTNTTNNANTF